MERNTRIQDIINRQEALQRSFGSVGFVLVGVTLALVGLAVFAL